MSIQYFCTLILSSLLYFFHQLFFIMLEDFCGKQFGILLWGGRGREGDGELLCFGFILFTVLSTIKL